MTPRLALLALAVSLAAMATQAAPVGLTAAGDGRQQVHRLPNGNLLGLWDVDTMGPGLGAAGPVRRQSAYDIVERFVSERGRILGFYNGPDPLVRGAVELAPVAWGLALPAGRHWPDALWIVWTGSALVYRHPSGRSRSAMNPGQVAPGAAPFEVPEVPLQASLVYITGGLFVIGGLGRMRRFRRSRRANARDA